MTEPQPDGHHSCYFCHQPLLWHQRTTSWLNPDPVSGEQVEVHSDCLEHWRAEHPANNRAPSNSPPAGDNPKAP